MRCSYQTVLRIKVRTTEFVHADGGSGFTADAQLQDGTS